MMLSQEFVKKEEADVLPHLSQQTEDLKMFEPQQGQEQELKAEVSAAKPTSHGCVGLGKGLEACCDVYDGKVDVYLHILGQRVAGRTIDSNGTSQDYSANIGFAKAEGSYRVDWSKKIVSVQGKACIWKAVKWSCVSYNKTILKW